MAEEDTHKRKRERESQRERRVCDGESCKEDGQRAYYMYQLYSKMERLAKDVLKFVGRVNRAQPQCNDSPC